MSSASAVRAGRAFVEIYGDLAPLQASLATVPAIMQATMAKSAAASVAGSAISVAASAHHAAAVGSVTAQTGVLNAATTAVARTQAAAAGTAVAAWGTVTGSLTGMTLGIAAARTGVRAFGVESSLAGRLLQGAMNSRGLISAGGVVSKIAGALTGSKGLQSLGTQLGRASLGMSIVSGLETGGWKGGLRAAVTGGVRASLVGVASGSIGLARKTLTGVFSLPRTAVTGTLGGVSALQRGFSALIPGMNSARVAADATTASLAQGGRVGGAMTAQLRGFGGGMMSLTKLAVGGMLGMVALGMKAATGFASKAAEIRKAARENGTSIGAETDKSYGTSLAGTLISESDVAAGAALSSQMTTLAGVVSVAWAQVGAAITPTLTSFFGSMTAVVQGIAIWLSRNRELVATGFRVAATVAQIAAGIGIVVGAMTVLGTVAAVALNPFTLLTAGVVAGIGYWSQYSAEGQSSLGIVSESASVVGDTVTTALGGIVAALSAGELELATQIALDGVKAIFVEATAAISGIWSNVMASLGNWLIDSGIMEAVNNVVTFIENGFTRIKEYVNGWLIWLQDAVGIISEQEAKAKGEANKKSADEAVATRNRQAAVENRMFREQPNAVKNEIEDNRQRELEAIRAKRDAERAAAQERLAASVQEATIAKKKQDGELATAAARRASSGSSAVKYEMSSMVQFGAQGAGRQGQGAVWTSMKRATEKTADNTGRLVHTVETALSFG